MSAFWRTLLSLSLVVLILAATQPGLAQSDSPTAPPTSPVKLVFIHHSTGENWLSDGYGNLGQALADNHYFTSDTNYGWGPEGIGDRTDIPNWPEWFRSEQTPAIMEALFSESEQHANYTRSFADPGGENVIVMFKSCFPNSDLEGHPDDPPDPEGWLSVGHAKYVYNDILQYFASRPDKLFIVITAPPLSDATHAANARAFNDWLLNDWLSEAHYGGTNVAVFDFYNVLTSPQAHHRYANGQVEHVSTSSNTLAYPSGDDHPSEAGSQKATEEFIPLLNFFYQRWQANAPSQPPVQSQADDEAPAPKPTAAAPEAADASEPAGQGPAGAWIDTFEGPNALSGEGWRAYWDEATATRLACAPSNEQASGEAQSLQLDFAVSANSWATCELRFDILQDWQAFEGLAFKLHAAQAGLLLNVDLYAGTAESPATYVYTVEAPPEAAAGWIPIQLAWGDFHRVDWEENAGAPLENPSAIQALAFGFNTLPDSDNTGKLWVDDVQLFGGAPAGEPAPQPSATAQTAAESQVSSAEENPPAPETTPTPEKSGGKGLACKSTAFLPLAALAAVAGARRRARSRLHETSPDDSFGELLS